MNEYLATFFLAMVPVGELRGALPVALEVYELPIVAAIVISILGNVVPVLVLLALYQPVTTWLGSKVPFFKKIFDKVFDITKKRHAAKFQKWGAAALILFVAIPLPMTGAWSGSVAAFVFGIPYRKAVGYILIGLCIAAAIVTTITLAGTGLYDAVAE